MKLRPEPDVSHAKVLSATTDGDDGDDRWRDRRAQFSVRSPLKWRSPWSFSTRIFAPIVVIVVVDEEAWEEPFRS